VADDFDKIVVHEGHYSEALVISKSVILIANGYVVVESSNQNVITCCA